MTKASTTKKTLGVVARHLQAIWVNRKPANTQNQTARTLPGYNGHMADMYTADRATD